MFKYILLLELCSVITNSCLESTRYPVAFETHKECLVAGYQTGVRMSLALPDKPANEKKLFITFTCIEIEDL